MKKQQQNKHEFALFSDETVRLTALGKEYALRDEELLHRLHHILRVAPDDALVLFDIAHQVACSVTAVQKKEITVRVMAREPHPETKPALIWLLPLLEREAFEDALYALAAMGATKIYPVITEKSRKAWGSEKERERAQRVMIAAAEQSKHFLLPQLQETLTLQDAVEIGTTKIFFDAQGDAAYDVITALRKKAEPYVCLVGPEGDLTESEKKLVREHGFVFCKLTPSILKASAAVEVGMGILRSCL